MPQRDLADHTYDEVGMDGPHGLFVVERVRGLRFDYEGGIDEGLAAALAGWEDAGGPGGYRVERTSWGRRVSFGATGSGTSTVAFGLSEITIGNTPPKNRHS